MTDPIYQPLQTANIHWQEGQPFSVRDDDTYCSMKDGLAETQTVFIAANNLTQRWQQLNGQDFFIGETGFGTGLNFLTTLNHWLEQTHQGTLHFVSAELHPVSREDLISVYKRWPSLKVLSNRLTESYPPPLPGIHRLRFPQQRATLTLLYGDAETMLKTLHCANPNTLMDAWFLDGFAPAKNPQWTEALFETLGRLSHPGTSFSTSTSASSVRLGLESNGFKIQKHPDFGEKRDMLVGEYTQTQQHKNNTDNAWRIPKTVPKPTKTALIIGAGIAGCATAAALANRGIKTTVIDKHPHPAAEASGNPQAIIYPKLSLRMGLLSRFSLAALSYSMNYYRPFWAQQYKEKYGHRCGLLLLPPSPEKSQEFQQLADLYPTELVQLLEQPGLSIAAGINLSCENGLYFPNLGWINPKAVCQKLLDHPLIEFQQGLVTTINPLNQQWQVLDQQQQLIQTADSIIIACSNNATNFEQTQHLPLKPIAGQITIAPTSDESRPLKTVLCGKGYIAPARDNRHTLGASYRMNTQHLDVTSADHQSNIQQLKDTDPALGSLFATNSFTSLDGRCAIRCTTPDYLPLAGPAPIKNAFLNNYGYLRKDARKPITTAGDYYPNLYINCGHGSRGMTYAPLCAELIANQICDEFTPLNNDLLLAIHPARFLIRDLKRNKI